VRASLLIDRPSPSLDRIYSVVSYFLRYFSSTSTEQISPDSVDLSPVSIRLALLFLLSVTDGTHSANIALLGNYLASTFVASSDGHGGSSLITQSTAMTDQSPFLSQPRA
jgi:hypothetical protein